MRSVIIVSILFIILLSFIFINSFFITSSSNDLISTARSIPAISSHNCLGEINRLKARWDKFEKAASFTVSYTELTKISRLIDELYFFYSCKDETDFNYCIQGIISSLEELSRFERFSLSAIF